MHVESDKNNCGELNTSPNHASNHNDNDNDHNNHDIYENTNESNSSSQNGIAEEEVSEENGDGSTHDGGSGDSERHLHSTSRSHSHDSEERTAIQRVVSTMFGRARREASEEEKTRHLGVVWKKLTVRGVGLGSTLQPTCADIFLGIPRLLGRIFTGKIRRKQPVRDILDDFSVRVICLI